MNDFWSNIYRYPRFFISSMVGLILVILAPFKVFLKAPKLRILLLLFLIIFSGLLYLILKKKVVYHDLWLDTL